MTTAISSTKPSVRVQPQVLVVDDETSLHELVEDTVATSIDCRVLSARSLSEARQILSRQQVELVVLDVHLPDGDGITLLPELRREHPFAEAIIITGDPNLDCAIGAIRHGAVDFVPKPFGAQDLVARVRQALHRQSLTVKNERRLLRLRDTVRRLNESRKQVSRKVDLLCNDLIGAYGDLSRQVETVRKQESFRKLLTQAKDLEQVLCHAMDWLLRHLGYSNLSLWLAAGEQEFQLGAYMKYTIAGDEALTSAMREGLVPLTVREGLLNLSNDDVQDILTPAELDYLGDQTVLATNCTYLGESLGVIVMFRDCGTPYSDEDAELLKAVAPIFAGILAGAVRREEPGSGDGPVAEGPQDDEGDDWWKRGEPSPY